MASARGASQGSSARRWTFLRRSALAVHGPESPLNRVDFAGLEERLTTLCADPGRDRFPDNMVALPIDAERCCRAHHTALAVKTFHGQTLLLKSCDHCRGSGR